MAYTGDRYIPTLYYLVGVPDDTGRFPGRGLAGMGKSKLLLIKATQFALAADDGHGHGSTGTGNFRVLLDLEALALASEMFSGGL